MPALTRQKKIMLNLFREKEALIINSLMNLFFLFFSDDEELVKDVGNFLLTYLSLENFTRQNKKCTRNEESWWAGADRKSMSSDSAIINSKGKTIIRT